MKKIHFIILSALAALSLAACVQEIPESNEQIGINELDENGMAFILKSALATRSAEEEAPVVVNSYDLGKAETGEHYYLEESVTTLDGVYQGSPETRGTPVYTENLPDMYGTMAVAHHPANSGKIAKADVMSDVVFWHDGKLDNGGWRYAYQYTTDPWPDANPDKKYMFFFRMPAESPNVTLAPTETFNTSNGAISFSYTSPESAAKQQDILFAARSLSKNDYRAAFNASKAAPVLFQHVLTGVKFALGNDNSGTLKTHITKVEFRGFATKGDCLYSPRTENGGYVDDPDEYSSAYASGSGLPATVKWSNRSSTGVLSAEYDATQQNVDNTVTYTKEEDAEVDNHGNKFADSFYEGGASRNLNTEHAELTFWLIPQVVPITATLHVWFDVFDGTTTRKHELDLNLGQRLSQSGTNDWQPGEMRTFTLKPNIVEIEITDEVVENIKKNVVVTNTGNVREYVRCIITANWVDKTGDVVVGYTSETGYEFVTPWALNATGTGANFGTFTNLPGGEQGADKWVYSGGYYYFKDPIGPGEDLPATTPLFSQYTYNLADVPDVWLVNPANPLERIPAEDVHLEMDVAVQSVIADGYDTYTAAWAAAAAASPFNPGN